MPPDAMRTFCPLTEWVRRQKYAPREKRPRVRLSLILFPDCGELLGPSVSGLLLTDPTRMHAITSMRLSLWWARRPKPVALTV